MKPKIEMFLGKDGQWYFCVRASNGKIVCQSEGYTRRHDCLRGIGALCRAVDAAETTERA